MNRASTYNVNIIWENNSKGIMCSPDLSEQYDSCGVSSRAKFSKGMVGQWSSEHLFVAAISVCLMTTFSTIAEKATFQFASFNCWAKGLVEMVEGKLMIGEMHLHPQVVIQNEKYRKKAIRILKKAEDDCLIAHSMKSKITMEIDIHVKPILIENK